MLTATALTKRFGDKTAVEALSLNLDKGEIGGLLGLNGAGKTTSMQMLATFLPPTSGTAAVGGYDVVREPEKVRAIIGILGESNAPPIPSWTPYEFLSFFTARHDLPERESGARIKEFAKRFDFTRYLHTPMGSLSGGTKRKVDLVRAVISYPRVLLLDEPTREMDIPTKRQVWAALKEMAAAGTTILVASHDSLEIRRLCQRVTVLRASEVVFSGSVDTLGALTPSGEDGIDGSLAALLTGEAA